MVKLLVILELLSTAIGVFGATLIFIEFFQQPDYIRYDTEFESYSVNISPDDPGEYTWFGRAGALLLATAFAIQFFIIFLRQPI
ncbi:MAG: hypothetical protein ABEI06_09100 [Halobacteriaceae archaeon]